MCPEAKKNEQVEQADELRTGRYNLAGLPPEKIYGARRLIWQRKKDRKVGRSSPHAGHSGPAVLRNPSTVSSLPADRSAGRYDIE